MADMTLTDRDSHFEFGANWQSYIGSVDRARIDAAIAGLARLVPAQDLAGKTFLDIGCGSGLHSLAALLMGAARVEAIDIDENSAAAARALLTQLAPRPDWRVQIASVFDAPPAALGVFDVVYSWGVLHHTGDMWRAIGDAARFVRPGGLFCLAIYTATPSDAFWKLEKRLYARAPSPLQWVVRQLYMGALLAAKALTGKNPVAHVRDYPKNRGMNFSHDAHDWLGGYPYETASAEEMRERVAALGFEELRSFPLPKTAGLFGSGCNEFVFRKR